MWVMETSWLNFACLRTERIWDLGGLLFLPCIRDGCTYVESSGVVCSCPGGFYVQYVLAVSESWWCCEDRVSGTLSVGGIFVLVFDVVEMFCCCSCVCCYSWKLCFLIRQSLWGVVIFFYLVHLCIDLRLLCRHHWFLFLNLLLSNIWMNSYEGRAIFTLYYLLFFTTQVNLVMH